MHYRILACAIMGLVIPSGLSVKAYRCHKKWKENWDVLKYDSRIDSEKERNEIPKSIITSIFIMCKLSFEYHCSWNPSLCFTSWKIVNFIDKHHFLKPIFFFWGEGKSCTKLMILPPGIVYELEESVPEDDWESGAESKHHRWVGVWQDAVRCFSLARCLYSLPLGYFP